MFNQTKGPRNKKSILSSEDVHLRKLKNFCVNPEEQWSIAQKSSALPSIKKLLKSACVLNPESRVQKIWILPILTRISWRTSLNLSVLRPLYYVQTSYLDYLLCESKCEFKINVIENINQMLSYFCGTIIMDKNTRCPSKTWCQGGRIVSLCSWLKDKGNGSFAKIYLQSTSWCKKLQILKGLDLNILNPQPPIMSASQLEHLFRIPRPLKHLCSRRWNQLTTNQDVWTVHLKV